MVGAPAGRLPHSQTSVSSSSALSICIILPAMDSLTIFGALAVAAMLLFYALEDRSAWYVLAFAGACLASSVYGFLQGAWPFGVVELIWSGVALRRWWARRYAGV